MTRKEIIEITSNSIQKKPTFPLTDLLLLRAVANVRLEMDRDENEYYYKVKIDDLIDKDLKKEVLSDNKWVLSGDENYILLYI